MPFKIITIPFDDEKEIFLEDSLNQFCLNKKILSRRIEFFNLNGKAYWTVFIEYDTVLEPLRDNIDGLNEADQMLYNRFRQWRQEKAKEQGVPVFIIATNKILQSLTVKKPATFESLKEIKGFGRKKIEKYGKEILDIIKGFTDKN